MKENGCKMTYIAHIDLIGLDGSKFGNEGYKAKFVNMVQQTHPANILRIKELLSKYDPISKIASS